ncbi:hypothetical protein PTKU15_93280 [Paraburkholderia terrae]|nr:hypothetical protein PTKU15_93280 [Paraburkholderia terrae]
MAQTTGLVQRLNIFSPTAACVWIGPRPNNAEVLLVTNDGSAADSAFAGTLIETLASAATNFRAVVATHGNTDAKITALQIDPV